ncbi:MAG TPA: sigma-70 family RNA polymerase sigma factor [Longimicrobiaceae bacterium]|nr:sigma-70 family RNA polymerase sigma factor [Longimicrobiaceae bacterium]
MSASPEPTLSGAAFPATRHSVLAAVRGADPEARARALDTLAAAYWKPVYKHLRLRWRVAPEDAEDLTQGFFARALERELFHRYDPEQARLRTWLRTCLDSFVANERKAAGRLKRGGGAVLVPLDVPGAERELEALGAAAPDDPEACFEREWVRSLFTLAVDRLRARCEAAGKLAHFELFERYDVEGPGSPGRVTYRELADERGIPVTQVTNHLSVVRRWFREGVLELLREISGSEAEFRAEARALLGVDPP